MFGRRKKYEQLYVVIVTVDTGDGIGSGQCVIGPMREDVANDFAALADEMVSADWGETLNGIHVDVTFTPMPVLLPTTGGDWTRQRIETLVATEEVRSLSAFWGGDRDGQAKDDTPRERPGKRNHPSAWGKEVEGNDDGS